MPEIEQRLANCFATVFSNLGESEIHRASHTSVANWDSLATITLISVIEEEFDLSVPPEDFEYMVSFPLILECVKRRTGNGS